jgi:hypothetical protein
VKGWASKEIIDSYDLRVIMTVLNFMPDRSQVMRLATIAKYKWLWWTASFRWHFGNNGAHAGNHFMSEGISFGIRYRSQIIDQNDQHQCTLQ